MTTVLRTVMSVGQFNIDNNVVFQKAASNDEYPPLAVMLAKFNATVINFSHETVAPREPDPREDQLEADENGVDVVTFRYDGTLYAARCFQSFTSPYRREEGQDVIRLFVVDDPKYPHQPQIGRSSVGLPKKGKQSDLLGFGGGQSAIQAEEFGLATVIGINDIVELYPPFNERGLCKIMLLINLHYRFDRMFVKLGGPSAPLDDKPNVLPDRIHVYIGSVVTYYAYKCYARAAAAFGYTNTVFRIYNLDDKLPRMRDSASVLRELEESAKPGAATLRWAPLIDFTNDYNEQFLREYYSKREKRYPNQ